MAKVIQTGPKKKESSVEKKRRRENTLKAREQGKRFVIPLLVLLFVLLTGYLFMKFGSGKSLTPEAREKIRSQRQMAKMLRQYGGDYSKLKEMLEAAGMGVGAGEAGAGAASGAFVDEVSSGSSSGSGAEKVPVEEDEEVSAD